MSDAKYPELSREEMAEYSIRRQRERREWLLASWRRNPRCHYCRNLTFWAPGLSSKPGLDPVSMHATLDHRIPRSRGGVDAPHNWVLACYLCNILKGDMSAKDYISELIEAGIIKSRPTLLKRRRK